MKLRMLLMNTILEKLKPQIFFKDIYILIAKLYQSTLTANNIDFVGIFVRGRGRMRSYFNLLMLLHQPSYEIFKVLLWYDDSKGSYYIAKENI